MNSEEIIELALNSSRSFSVKEAARLLYSAIEPAEIDYNNWAHKHYFYEMRPLLWLAENLNHVDRIKFMGGLARYDGGIRFAGEKYFQKIEFTRAVDIDIQITKSTLIRWGFSFDASQVVSHDEILNNVTGLWDAAFRKKFEKNAKTLQYQGVWLAIVFDDDGLRYPDDKKALDILSLHFYRRHIRHVNRVFRRLFIIGLSSEYIFDSAFADG